ncbi:MAG: branched-chain amino acid ABC transporter permease [Actinomycetota bacterium]|nr:branched-chain amino acid ABC transporter permease [Actinomycetota bacterium]
MAEFVQLLFNGLVAGSIFGIAALGISLVYSVLRLVNFAAGDFLTLGAFTTFFLATSIHLPFIVAVLLSMLLGVVISLILEFLLWRKLRRTGAGLLALFLVATGVAFVLRQTISLIFGGNSQKFDIDQIKTFEFLGAQIAQAQLAVLCCASVAITFIALFIKKSTIGKNMRAYADNPSLASVSGINVDRVIIATWTISGAFGALAGVFQGTVQGQFTNGMGLDLFLSILAAVILGTIGDAYGALIGGFVLGVVMELSTWDALLGGIPSTYKPVVAFAVLVIVLLFKPEGIFGVKARKV